MDYWLTMLVTAVLVVAAPLGAGAYVGPGVGISAIGTVVAFFGAIFLAIVAFIWYPIKRVVKKFGRKGDRDGEATHP